MLMCGSRKYPYPPHGSLLKNLRGGGLKRVIFIFWRFIGSSIKKTVYGGGMDIF